MALKTCQVKPKKLSSWLLGMNCYSALTKEEALTTPPVTLANCFVKQVCTSLAFQLAGIHCSLLHMNLCLKEGLCGGGQQRHHADLLHGLTTTAWSSRQNNVPLFCFPGGKQLNFSLIAVDKCSLKCLLLILNNGDPSISNLVFSHSLTLLRGTR